MPLGFRKGKNTEEKRIRTAGEFFDYIGETKNIEAIELLKRWRRRKKFSETAWNDWRNQPLGKKIIITLKDEINELFLEHSDNVSTAGARRLALRSCVSFMKEIYDKAAALGFHCN